MATVIYTSAPAEEIRRFVRQLPGAIAGTKADIGRVGAGFRARLANEWYSLVAEDFDKLGRGEPGADGRTWRRNTPEYLAYGKGPKSSRQGLGSMPQNRLGGPPAWGGALGRGAGTGDLTHTQLKLWWAIYGPRKAAALRAGKSLREAKAIAAAYAWEKLKARGVSTKIARLGNRPDQVLVDRGTLRRSLQPGELIVIGEGAEYSPANGDQLFEEAAGSMVVGSKSKHAKRHHEGKGRLPKRTLWPADLPETWWQSIVGAAVSGLETIRSLFE